MVHNNRVQFPFSFSLSFRGGQINEDSSVGVTVYQQPRQTVGAFGLGPLISAKSRTTICTAHPPCRKTHAEHLSSHAYIVPVPKAEYNGNIDMEEKIN